MNYSTYNVHLTGCFTSIFLQKRTTSNPYSCANKEQKLACENSKRHSPDSQPLLGNLNDMDIVTECREQSLLKPKDNTLQPDL